MSTGLTLVSHHLCPYVQRAAVALAEKKVAFERVHIDLANKPDWFTALSPLGKVPLLHVRDMAGETVIFESAVILEFLEETQPRPLHPADPRERARHRAWMEFGSAALNGIARFYAAGDEAGFLSEEAKLSDMFSRVERELEQRQGDGPWFAGGDFSLVDAVFGPIFRYFDVFETVTDLAVLEGKPHVAAWRAALRKRPSVAGAVTADYPQRLRVFLAAKDSFLGRLTKVAA